jgi:putative tryptophan/tyrosine transport system substrate-binding protein
LGHDILFHIATGVIPSGMGQMAIDIGRRDIITLLGSGMVTWPLAAQAQQPAMPVIGYLNYGSPASENPSRLTGLRRGLNETGYVEGRNFVIESRWAENQPDRLPALAADLVERRVAVIVAAGVQPALTAKAATTSIPIVFSLGVDPVQLGLVASLNRPGGNLTGVNGLVAELGAKSLAVLHELVPSAETIGFLENPHNETIFEPMRRDLAGAASVIGLKVQILKAGSDGEIEGAFKSLVQAGTRALLVGNDTFFSARVEQVAELAARYAIPTMYSLREFVLAGGLISYGASLVEAYQQVGVYVGKILNGTKPADLPVVQPTKIEMIINLKAAKALRLDVPDRLLATADDVIE